MSNKRFILILFFITALVQLYVPAKMIINQETIIKNGQPFKFRIAPVDPLDPFRGKFITLDFKDITAAVPDIEKWQNDAKAYVELATDQHGYAVIQSVTKTKPAHAAFVEAKVGFIGSTKDKKIFVKYPFDRFYMEETKASGAETIYREAARDSSKVACALVYVHKGDAALTDVLINEVSIRKIVEEYNKKHE